jgi:thiol-disulfide isomerase/thioredoxin
MRRAIPRPRASTGRAAGLIAIVLLVGGSMVTAQRPSSALCNAAPVPGALDHTLKDTAGRDVSLRSFAGKVVLLNFWATWCVPCKIEIPSFVELYSRYRGRGVEIVGVDVGEAPATVAPYVREMKVNYPVLLTGDRKDLLTAFGIDVGLPTTVIINRDGTVCRKRVGLMSRELFEQVIKALL